VRCRGDVITASSLVSGSRAKAACSTFLCQQDLAIRSGHCCSQTLQLYCERKQEPKRKKNEYEVQKVCELNVNAPNTLQHIMGPDTTHVPCDIAVKCWSRRVHCSDMYIRPQRL